MQKKIVAKHLVVWQKEELLIKKTPHNNNNPQCEILTTALLADFCALGRV